MPDVKLEVQKPLDLLDQTLPKLSSIDDMPVVETKPDATPAAPAEEAVQEESATSEQPEVPAASDEPKKAKGVQKRIDELVTQREDNKRRAEAAEARLDRALQALERSTGAPAEKAKEQIEDQNPEPKRPNRQEYMGQDPELYDAAIQDYVEKRSAWIAKREVAATLAEERRKAAETQQAEQQRKIQETYRDRVTKTKEKYADFSEVAERPDVQVSMPMAHVILTYEQGPDIQYYLGKNPAEVARISSLSPELQLMELGMIAASLKTPVQAPVSKPVSSAPAPGKPIKSSSESEPELENLPMEEYAKKVYEREAAKRKPGHRA